jgi:hypothetical protein
MVQKPVKDERRTTAQHSGNRVWGQPVTAQDYHVDRLSLHLASGWLFLLFAINFLKFVPGVFYAWFFHLVSLRGQIFADRRFTSKNTARSRVLDDEIT